MQIVRTVAAMQQLCRGRRDQSLGLVPTMGALHAGHLSLVRRALSENDSVAASIFVNPLQFGQNEDLEKYPRTFEADCAGLERAGVSVLFAPMPAEMYAAGASTIVDPGLVGTRLDGASRAGHFIGVATVVAKLFHIVQPDRAYFGQKDAAQLAVIRRMVTDLNFAIEIVACPIVRDDDGLALSSRNRYLSEADRRQALGLPQTLERLRIHIEAGERKTLQLLRYGMEELAGWPGLVLDYLAIVDPDTLLPLETASTGALVAVAASVGTTRLIDNFLAP